MTLEEIQSFVAALPDVEQEENFGYSFYFVGDNHMLAFVTIGHEDNEFDDISNLDREGVFRLNIGVSRETFNRLVAQADSEDIDYSQLNVFLPHPHYAKQNFICILNPGQEKTESVKQLILEAHAIAGARYRRRRSE